MDGVTIKQLEKALECKDDKELRMRVEVLLDFLKEGASPYIPPTIQPTQPVQPLQPIPNPTSSTAKKSKAPRPNSAGAIVGGEQITYSRPAGT